jgi:hypothetical protein
MLNYRNKIYYAGALLASRRNIQLVAHYGKSGRILQSPKFGATVFVEFCDFNQFDLVEQ